MNFDERLQAAWQDETGRAEILEQLTARVARQRRRRLLKRAGEIALSVAAVAVLGYPLATGGMEPVHWLLLPFFAVFLPVVWLVTLRAPRPRAADASQRVSDYARLRLAQLKSGLRDLWLARRSAQVLLGYAVLAFVGSWWLGDAAWRGAALILLFYAVVWLACTFLIRSRLVGRRLREYRKLRRLISG